MDTNSKRKDPWGGGKTKIDQKKEKKNSLASVSGQETKERSLSQSRGMEPSFPFCKNVSVKCLHVEASLQGLSRVTQSAYINPNTSKTSAFCGLAMAKTESKQ